MKTYFAIPWTASKHRRTIQPLARQRFILCVLYFEFDFYSAELRLQDGSIGFKGMLQCTARLSISTLVIWVGIIYTRTSSTIIPQSSDVWPDAWLNILEQATK
jgi:hypothetical protein